MKGYSPVFRVPQSSPECSLPRSVQRLYTKASVVSLDLTSFCKLLYQPACEHAVCPKKLQEDENQEVTKGVEKGFVDDRLIGLLRKRKGKRVLGRSSEKEDGQKEIKKVRVGQE